MPPLLRQQDFCPLHDLPRCHLEHLGKLEERPKGWAADASFQQADIGSIKAAIQGELLLGDVNRIAKFPQGFPEGPFRPRVPGGFAAEVAFWTVAPTVQCCYAADDIPTEDVPNYVGVLS